MVNIQFWLTYHPYYGENNKIGLALMQAQTNQIAVAHFLSAYYKRNAEPIKIYPGAYDHTR